MVDSTRLVDRLVSRSRETIARLLSALEGRALSPSIGQRAESPTLEIDVEFARSENVAEYELCRELRIAPNEDLHLVAPELLAAAVEDVVRIEGPVHLDEVIRRIRTVWRLQRAGNRIVQ